MKKNKDEKKDLVLKSENLPVERKGFEDYFADAGVALPEITLDEYFPGSTKPRLPQIKILNQAGMFQLPDGSKVDDFTGILIPKGISQCNALWMVPFSKSGGGSIPDCFSLYGVSPDDSVAEPKCNLCALCEFAQFGSDVDDKGNPTKGKRCKNMVRLHFLLDGSRLPSRLTITPGNIGEYETFSTELFDKAVPYYQILVKVSTFEKQNSNGVAYSGIKFENLGGYIDILDPDIAIEKTKLMVSMLKNNEDQMKNEEILSEEFNPLEKNEGEPY